VALDINEYINKMEQLFLDGKTFNKIDKDPIK